MSADRPLLDNNGRALDLSERADAFAKRLVARFPGIVFVSGRREIDDQAHALAGNIVAFRDRRWITKTYRYVPIRVALQRWLDEHPGAISVGAITNGLASVLRSFSAEELERLSLHFTGDAFDLRVVEGPRGDEIHGWLTSREAAGEIVFLDHEGGARRWHVQVLAQSAQSAPGGPEDVP